jgi:hypothetical protein
MREKFLEQLAVIRQAPMPHALAFVIGLGLIWLASEWRYGGIIANRDSEITLLKTQRDDYKDKLGGASPDQAKARIDALGLLPVPKTPS